MTNETPRYDTDDDSVVEADVDNASVQTDDMNNVRYVRPGDDPQTVLNDAYSGDPRQSAVVRFAPNPAPAYDFSNASLPLIVPEGVQLDLRRTYFNLDADPAEAIFSLTSFNTVLTHGMDAWASAFENSFFMVDGDRQNAAIQEGPWITGYGKIRLGQNGNAALHLRETTGGLITGCRAELVVENAGGTNAASVRFESSGTGGFINDNDIEIYGTVGQSGSRFVSVETPADGGVSFNRIYGQVQYKSSGTPYIARFDGGAQNLIYLGGSDLFNGQIEWTSNAAPCNRVLVPNVYGDNNIATTDNSPELGNFVAADLPLAHEKIDPSGMTGPWDGYSVRLAGTQGTEDTLAIWSASQSAWVKQEDGATFT